MSKIPLSEQLRERLDGLGKSLGKHARSLDRHFEEQVHLLNAREESILARQQEAKLIGPPEEDTLTLEGMPKKGLQELCRLNQLKGWSRLNRAQLIDFLGSRMADSGREGIVCDFPNGEDARDDNVDPSGKWPSSRLYALDKDIQEIKGLLSEILLAVKSIRGVHE